MMMNGRAALLTFPPDIEINPSPTGFHDMLIGIGAPFYNELLSGLQLNITLVVATLLGRCTYEATNDTASCDGIAGILASGAGDFSIIPMSLTTYDPQIKDIPLRFGPELYEAGWMFTSFPYQKAHKKAITISYTLTEIPLYYGLIFLFYILTFFIINYSVSRGKFLRRATAIQMYGVVLMQPTVTVIRAHRRLIYWLGLALSIMTFQLLMGSTNSNMVIVIPPKYYRTYQEIAASNETPTFLAGLVLEENFDKSAGDRDKQILIRRATERGTRLSAGQEGVWMTIASKIKETVQFFDNRMEALNILGISCFQTDFQPPYGLKFSDAFDYSVAIVVYSQYIKPALRQRVSRFYQKMIESGVYDRYLTDVRISLSTLGNMDRLTMCMTRLMNHKHQDSDFKPSHPGHFSDFLLLCLSMMILSLCVMAHEVIRKRKNQKHQRKRRRSNAQWILVKGQTVIVD